MLDNIIQVVKRVLKSRLFPMIVVYALLFGTILGRLFYLQIVKGNEYEAKATYQSEKIREIKSSRGKIYDCNGTLLASNVQSYAVTYEDTGELKENADKNAMIIRCINIIEKNGDQIDLEFPITLTSKGKLKFTDNANSILRFKRDIYYKKTVDELTDEEKHKNAAEVFADLRSATSTTKFDIDDTYTQEQALKIMTVRYAMMMNMYQKYVPITISANVSATTVAAIEENYAELPGVTVSEESKRVYYKSQYFSHLIGYTGLISADQLAQMQDEDENTTYTATDQIGKSGIESTYEDILKGAKGSETIVIDDSSRIVETKNQVMPTAGNDVYLTIDADLQEAYYKILEKKIAGILISKLNNSTDAGTKGKSATNIRVPIYDVYNALIENSIIDVEHFSASDASSLEKSIYSKFKTTKRSTLRNIKSQLNINNTLCGSQITSTMQDFLDYIYSVLIDNGMVLTANIDKTDTKYTQYIKEKISMSSYLKYAITKNWINLDLLDIGNDYYSTEEIYSKLVQYIFDTLNNETDFDKRVYKQMIYNYSLSGQEVCLLLYDQGVLTKNKSTNVNGLRSGSIHPFSFIKSKIKSLEITPGELGLEPCSGSLVVTDVNTGKVKAMVSYPSYDNNKFANSVDSSYFAYINSNTSSPLLNRATLQKTAPGSTFKMLTSVTSLEEGIITPTSTVTDKVTFSKINKPYPKCWSSTSHGTINVTQAIQDSCNYFFYEMGYRLGDGKKDKVNNEKGIKTLKKYIDKFGLSETSGVELTEADPTMPDTDCVRAAIGQDNNSYTPAQLSRYVTTIANGGTCYNLTIIDKTVDTVTNKTTSNKAKVRNKVNVQSSTWNAITEGMKRVVANGSIKNLFKNSPVVVAGKTGTAQESTSKPNHALFVSFAPADDPEISVTAVIANGYTSSNAAELASDVYMYYYNKKSRKRLMNMKVSVPRLDTLAFSD